MIRRQFIKSIATTSTAVPMLHLGKRLDPLFQDEVITGEKEYQFRVDHQCVQLPSKYKWQTTHNVAVDSANNLYVIHEGWAKLKDHPSIFVFSPDGKFIRAFGCQFQGGGHGIEVRQEGSEEFLYVAAYQQVKAIAKLTLLGETVWYQKAPMQSGLYDEGEHLSTQANWKGKGFLPTNFAFLDDGGFLLADGYGTHTIHRYDSNAKWVSYFGGAGDEPGQFRTAHGLWIDKRSPEPKIVVTNRARNTLKTFTLQGEYIDTLPGFGLPANIDIRGNLMLVSELKARVAILNEKNEIVARLGVGAERLKSIEKLREKPDQWQPGEFVHPHDACFDKNGNIFVAEWVKTGRVTKLTKV